MRYKKCKYCVDYVQEVDKEGNLKENHTKCEKKFSLKEK